MHGIGRRGQNACHARRVVVAVGAPQRRDLVARSVRGLYSGATRPVAGTADLAVDARSTTRIGSACRLLDAQGPGAGQREYTALRPRHVRAAHPRHLAVIPDINNNLSGEPYMRKSIAGPAVLTVLIALLFPAHTRQASGSEANTSAARTSRH